MNQDIIIETAEQLDMFGNRIKMEVIGKGQPKQISMDDQLKLGSLRADTAGAKEEIKVTEGFAFHVHHDKLVEYCTDYDGRVDYIRVRKPTEERTLRLKLFRMIPVDRVPAPLLAAQAAYDKAQAAYEKALAACDKAQTAYEKALAACDKALAAYDKALAACDKALAAYDKALAAYDKARAARIEAVFAYQPHLEKMHGELCPECPWDGETIFPRLKPDSSRSRQGGRRK